MLAWVTYNPDEISGGRKPKVSYSTTIGVGLVGPKLMPKGESDGQLVNIPALQFLVMEGQSIVDEAFY